MVLLMWGKRFKHDRRGVRQNAEKALDMFTKAAARGSALAMVDAGLIHWERGEKHKALNLISKLQNSETLLLSAIWGFPICKGKVPLLSVEALHYLHIFIFVLAVVHVTFCVLTIVFGGLRIRQWKHWEDPIEDKNQETQPALQPSVTHVHQDAFIKDRFTGLGKDYAIRGWLKSFFKQFYGSVTKLDYITLRLGFIMTH